MASTNQSPAYLKVQGKFLTAQTSEERLNFLEEMIKECPKHKSSENMLANLTTRYKKLKEKITKAKKSGKTSKVGIKKYDLQAVITGFSNTGKSSLMSVLTNASPKISDYKFTTTKPIIGMMNYSGTLIQIIENPAIESEFYDKGLTNTADTILILVDNLEQIKQIEKQIPKFPQKKIILFNKKDKLTEEKIRKLHATLQSKKYNFVLISTKTQENIGDLKDKLFSSFNKIRVYTKEPGKEKSQKPIILNQNSTIKDVAEKILHGFSEKIKETKLWGPSSKFSAQKVGLKHKLKDLDVVEFKTR